MPALLLLGLLAGCSAHHATDDVQPGEPIQECDAFLSAYEHCLETLGPLRIAEARVEQARAGLVAQAGQGQTARVALRKQCTDNLSQLKATCR